MTKINAYQINADGTYTPIHLLRAQSGAILSMAGHPCQSTGETVELYGRAYASGEIYQADGVQVVVPG
jgi:hypothetical protein